MANNDTSFPKIADGNWWKLRDLFKRKVPSVVTPSYLASALSMSEASARGNIVSPFKKIGILEEDGKPSDMAYDWRDDSKYPAVCDKLLKELYPDEVRDLFHDPDVELSKVTNWFMNAARCGEPAARMFARFYMLLLRANPEEGTEAAKKPEKAPKKQAVKKQAKSDPTPKQEAKPDRHEPAHESPRHQSPQSHFRKTPELHINIQLHISPESSPEQIEKIFESMGKHLKDFS